MATPSTTTPSWQSLYPTTNISPQPQTGSGIFGQVPGDVSVPDISAQLGAEYPGLAGTNTALSGDILSNLQGTLSPGTQQALENQAATLGVTGGTPGSQLDWNSLYGNVANAATNQEALGAQQYNSSVPTVSGTQTVSPALQIPLAQQNSVWNAAPNPTDAGVFNLAMQALGDSGVSVSGGDGSGGCSC